MQKIDGVKLISLPVNVDDRGTLYEVLHNYDLPFEKFGQVYIVQSWQPGTVRAFHKHEKMWDYFHIAAGAAKFVLVWHGKPATIITERIDTGAIVERESLAPEPVIQTYTLTAATPQVLVVPPGVFHGWMSLQPNTMLVSTADQLYDKLQPDEVRVPPDTFGDVWEVKGR